MSQWKGPEPGPPLIPLVGCYVVFVAAELSLFAVVMSAIYVGFWA